MDIQLGQLSAQNIWSAILKDDLFEVVEPTKHRDCTTFLGELSLCRNQCLNSAAPIAMCDRSQCAIDRNAKVCEVEVDFPKDSRDH